MDQVSLGVDSHPLFSADMVTIARLWLQTTRLKLFNQVLDTWRIPSTNPMSVVQAFLMITRNGGLALRRPDLGVIRVGAKADIVIFDGTSPGMLGWIDPVAAVMLHSNPGDVEHVLVDGAFVKRDFSVVAKDYPAIKMRFLETAKWAQDTWREIPFPDREESFATGAAFAETITADVLSGNGTGYGRLYQ